MRRTVNELVAGRVRIDRLNYPPGYGNRICEPNGASGERARRERLWKLYFATVPGSAEAAELLARIMLRIPVTCRTGVAPTARARLPHGTRIAGRSGLRQPSPGSSRAVLHKEVI